MNKRPVAAIGRRPLWYVGDGTSTFAGPLGRNELHSHGVPVLLTGIYEPFRFRSVGGVWTGCRSALVPAGLAYEFDMAGQPLNVIYLEPSAGGVASLAPLLRGTEEAGGVLFGDTDHIGIARNLFEDQDSGRWAGEALADVLRYGQGRARRHLDPRIARVVSLLQRDHEHQLSAAQSAAAVGLSLSRFQHLFSRDVGVPFRRYRGWRRMLHAIGEISSGASFSIAAHAAGYADQPHFNRAFRSTFGASPTSGIQAIRG